MTQKNKAPSAANTGSRSTKAHINFIQVAKLLGLVVVLILMAGVLQ
jgi:hypothetical protein